MITIPKSSKVARIRQNADVFSFELTADDMEQLNALESNLRVTWDPTGIE